MRETRDARRNVVGVDVKPRTFGEPAANERRLAVVVVHAQVRRDEGLDQIEELAELDARWRWWNCVITSSVFVLSAANSVVRPCAAPLGRAAQAAEVGCDPGWDLRFFVDTKYRRVVRPVQIQPHDISHLLHEQRVGRQFERLAPMRLQAEGAPDPADSHPTQAHRLGHVPRAPARGPARGRFQGPNHHLLDL